MLSIYFIAISPSILLPFLFLLIRSLLKPVFLFLTSSLVLFSLLFSLFLLLLICLLLGPLYLFLTSSPPPLTNTAAYSPLTNLLLYYPSLPLSLPFNFTLLFFSLILKLLLLIFKFILLIPL